MIERIKDSWQNIASMSPETAQVTKFFLFGMVVADIFGVWWYLGMKSLGSALLIVILIALAVIMFIERKFDEVIPEKEVKPIMTIKCDECGKEFKTQNELTQHVMVKHYGKKEEKSKEDPKSEPKENPSEEPKDDMFGFGSLPDSEEYQKRSEEALGGGLNF